MLQNASWIACKIPNRLPAGSKVCRLQTVDYRTRVVDDLLVEFLDAAGAVVIEGPRACGKTETGRRASRSEVRIDTPGARDLFAVSPELLLAGPTPRLLDEWQAEPDLWNEVRRMVDDRRDRGQFILTGSAVPRDDPNRHPGSGRFLHLRMRPMTLFETGHSTGVVSLASVLDGSPVRSQEPGLTVPELAERIVVGGWPGNLGLSPLQAQRALLGYIEDLCTSDIRRLDGTRRDPRGVRRLLSSLARNISTPATLQLLTTDTNGPDGGYVADTVRGYLASLTRLWVVDDLAPWHPAIRSRARLRSAAVRHLADPSLATAALKAGTARVLADINWMGLLFESLVVRDLRVYADRLDASVFHYRDSNGLEADVIVELPDGRWAAFEIKLGASPAVVDVAAANLVKLATQVDRQPPVALAVITGTGWGFTRRDGVHQIPIGALAP